MFFFIRLNPGFVSVLTVDASVANICTHFAIPTCVLYLHVTGTVEGSGGR